jgi:hypothetical protein
MILFKDKINYKMPQGDGFEPHLDAPAYDHIGKIEHLTANFAINAATLANGCLEVVPGSHRMSVDLANGGRISDSWVNSHEWVSVPLDEGDVLLFGSRPAHRSGPNRTDRPRASLYKTFHGCADGEDLREKYYGHRRVMFPSDHSMSNVSFCLAMDSMIFKGSLSLTSAFCAIQSVKRIWTMRKDGRDTGLQRHSRSKGLCCLSRRFLHKRMMWPFDHSSKNFGWIIKAD